MTWLVLFINIIRMMGYVRLRLRLDLVEKPRASVSGVSFFFLRDKPYCYGYCSWTVATIFDFPTFSAYQWVPCTVHGTHKPHISTIFFIKNRSHGTIHTFKNYFAIMFFSFQLYPNRPWTVWIQLIFAETENIVVK